MTLRPTYRHPRARDYLGPGGSWDIPSLDATVSAAARGARGGLVVDDSAGARLDGAGLEARVAALAGGLRGAGVRRGDVVAWQSPNWHEAVLLYRACWRLGAIAAPIHHQAGPADVDRMLGALDARVWLPGDEVRGPSARLPKLLDAGTPVTRSAARPSDLAVVLFTSGSSGVPKAALHTQRGLAYKARIMIRAHELVPGDSILMPAPLAHVSGLLNAVLIPGVLPMRATLMAKWSPEDALATIERERITFMIGPPTFFVGLMGTPGFASSRVESLRLISSGGAGVTPAFVEQASNAFGARVKRTYGSTEAPTVTTSTPRDSVERARETDGHATGAVELRVSDPDTGRARLPGELGELWLRGPELFVGYADARQTRAAIHRGWFCTGDLATVDADGWLTIAGRMKDVIIRGGENISAGEVEGILEAHPAVRQAAVVGEPDARLGERVCAFVVASGPFDLAACRAWFAEQGVAVFKTPERVVQVDALPLLAAGKPDRAALMKRAQRFGVAEAQ
ncbi:MAG TPA: AMP-binding protein [Acidimicrobiia bacterium]|nr:AMP-binding protein [Acidimicrobiia bacterium]